MVASDVVPASLLLAAGGETAQGIMTIVVLGIFFLLILIGLFVGKTVEKRHLRSLAQREAVMHGLLTTNLRKIPPDWDVTASWLVTGSVVIASDYFKSFGAKLKNLIGGHLRTLETLLVRARREALLRLQEQARREGADGVMNVRFEFCTIARMSGNQGIPPVEVLAYGTAIKFAAGPVDGSA
ncbi:MAG TPA: heavy metal-binding domain-containing protein [Planctomycetota bacterium]|nr:heavy metal-binding domain-containing protein [Planctomycetota bacterium]